MECDLMVEPSQISVNLDDEDKAALRRIKQNYESAGLFAALMSATHVLSWTDMDVGLVTVGNEDWLGLAKTIIGSNKVILAGVSSTAARQYQRHNLRGTPEQAQFWAIYQSIVARALKGKC